MEDMNKWNKEVAEKIIQVTSLDVKSFVEKVE